MTPNDNGECTSHHNGLTEHKQNEPNSRTIDEQSSTDTLPEFETTPSDKKESSPTHIPFAEKGKLRETLNNNDDGVSSTTLASPYLTTQQTSAINPNDEKLTTPASHENATKLCKFTNHFHVPSHHCIANTHQLTVYGYADDPKMTPIFPDALQVFDEKLLMSVSLYDYLPPPSSCLHPGAF